MTIVFGGGRRADVSELSPAAPRVCVQYAPVLDVARGIAAGYQAQAHPDVPGDFDFFVPDLLSTDEDGVVTAHTLRHALSEFATMPRNTFLALPVSAAVAATTPVRNVLLDHGSLSGVVLDVLGFTASQPVGALEDALAEYAAAGARISVGGHGAAQPELTSIVRLKPSILRLGRDWVRDVDRSDAKRSAIEVIGQLAGQLDAWILAEGVSTSAELRTLASLGVPLAQGSFIGEPTSFWPEVDSTARMALPPSTTSTDGVLRELIQQAYTTRDAVSAAAVLPETTGFDVIVVLDDHRRPVSMLEQGPGSEWEVADVLGVNIDTPVADAVARAMMRPRATRFTPLACTDNAGRFLGVLRIERLMARLAGTS